MKQAMYLNPLTPVTFHKVFGQNPELTTDFLNTLLPPEKDEDSIINSTIDAHQNVEYNCSHLSEPISIRCTKKNGDSFIVETFLIHFKTDKTQILQEIESATAIPHNKKEPVHSLFILKDSVPDSDNYYTFRQTVSIHQRHGAPEGSKFIFIETSNCSGNTSPLWLRFLSEMSSCRPTVSPELLSDPVIGKAVALLDSDTYTEIELNTYHAYIELVKTVRSIADKAYTAGQTNGRIKGLEEGFDKWYKDGVNSGIMAGSMQQQRESARRMKVDGISSGDIIRWTGIREYELDTLEPIQ